jgi:hypothetical protein
MHIIGSGDGRSWFEKRTLKDIIKEISEKSQRDRRTTVSNRLFLPNLVVPSVPQQSILITYSATVVLGLLWHFQQMSHFNLSPED